MKIIKKILIGLIEFTIIPTLIIYFFSLYLEQNEDLKYKIPRNFRKINDYTFKEKILSARKENDWYDSEDCSGKCILKMHNKKYNVTIVLYNEISLKNSINKCVNYSDMEGVFSIRECIRRKLKLESIIMSKIPKIPDSGWKYYRSSVLTKNERGYLNIIIYVDNLKEIEFTVLFANFGDILIPCDYDEKNFDDIEYEYTTFLGGYPYYTTDIKTGYSVVINIPEIDKKYKFS